MARKEMHTGDLQLGSPDDIVLGDGSVARGGGSVEAIDKPLNKDYMDELAFMEEMVTVIVSESADENAENPVQVGNNGIFVQFFRGQMTTCKRKFVDCLISKTTRVTTPEVFNGGGERTRAIRQSAALKYPFTVVEDRNPKGSEWLRRRMAEAY